MAIRISGPGVGLPRSAALFPHSVITGPYTPVSARFMLNPGAAYTIPAGTWLVAATPPAQIQYLDPSTQEWTVFSSLVPGLPEFGWPVFSDGFNLRVQNLSGVAYSGHVTAPGSGYIQASTAVVASPGNSQWQAIVGGAVASIVPGPAVGRNYTIAPTMIIAEPELGLSAFGTVTLGANGEIASLTVVNGGAGYRSVPFVRFLTNPNDPNFDEIGPAGEPVVTLGPPDQLTAVLLLKSGMPLAAPPTLTITGAGTGATAAVLGPSPWLAPTPIMIRVQGFPG